MRLSCDCLCVRVTAVPLTMTKRRWQLLAAITTCSVILAMFLPVWQGPEPIPVFHHRRDQRASKYISDSTKPQHPKCREKALPLRLIGSQWLEAVFDKKRAVDPPQLGHVPLAGERWLWFGREQFGEQHLLILEQRLETLRDLTTLLDRFGIAYWLSSGTLMGAYRHGAMLPWDDDADIVVPNEQKPMLHGEAFRNRARALGLQVQEGYFCNAEQYIPAVAYLKRNVHGNTSKLDLQSLFDDCTSSIGFFGRVQRWHEREELRAYVDIWTAFPISLDNRTLYSYGGGAWLFSFMDIFPLQPCWLNGHLFFLPGTVTAVVIPRLQNLTASVGLRRSHLSPR